MSSGVLNLFFDRFLSEIVEIDASKTNFSLLTGELELRNLKIKDEIFQKLNLPFVEVVHGYVGCIKISLDMPFFYEHAIKVFVSKIFFHARLKSVNKLNKEEEIKNMQKLKESNLLSAEQIYAEVLNVKMQDEKKEQKKGPGIVEKIINNLYVEINDIVIKLDDEISYPRVPYSIGVILDNIQIRSTRSDFKIPKDKDEVIPFQEINHKVVVIDNFSVYMDCLDRPEDLDYTINLIDEKVKRKIHDEQGEIQKYLGEKFSFYAYCMSEVYAHSRKFEAHQYILHQLDLSVKVSLNTNVNNKEPEIKAIIEFPQIILGVSLKQIKTAFKLLAYLDLATLFKSGIEKEFYDKELTQNEINQYRENYLSYFQKKYIEKKNVEFPTSLINMEERLNYNQISEMRNWALQKLKYILKINELSKKIENEEGNLFGKNSDIIVQLHEERNRVLRLEDEFIKTGKAEPIENIEEEEKKKYGSVEDSYTKIYAKIDILVISFTIFETVNRQGKAWELKDKLISLGIKDLGVEAKIQKVGLIALIHLDNIIISQEKTQNPNYNKVFFGDLTVDEKLLYIKFEMNPKLPKSDMKINVSSKRQVFIIADTYALFYIKEKILKVLSTGIDLEEAGSYAREGIYNYIKDGYQHRLVEGTVDDINFKHTNFYLDVDLLSPYIIIPMDASDLNNNQCITMSLGRVQVKTILPPRVDKDIKYSETKKEILLYDIYRVNIKGIGMSTMQNCIEKNNYEGIDDILLKEFDVSVEAKLLIQPKNKSFDNMIINVLINKIDFQLNEFQIVFLIQFLGHFQRVQIKVDQEIKQKLEEEHHNKRKANEQALQTLSEEAKKEKEKEDANKRRKKKEEMKKKKEEENIKRAKIVYEKVIKSFSMADHSIAKLEIQKAKTEKKSILVNLIIEKTEFSIQKKLPNLNNQDYLKFEIDLIKVEVDIMLNGIMFIYLLIKHIILSDKDADKGGKVFINNCYSSLIESTKENQIGSYGPSQESKYCFIDLNLLMLGEEMDIFINMNDLHIMISLNSILRLMHFGLYYLELFTQENFYTETEKYLSERHHKDKNQKAKNEELEREELNKDYMARLKKYVNNFYTVEQIKDYINKTHKVKTLESYIEYFADIESSKKGKRVMVTSERKRSKMRIIFNMNNTMFKMPLDPNNLEEPLLSMYFDMTFSMDSTNVYDNIINYHSRDILAQIYETKTSLMHISLSQFEFDMIYLKNNIKSFSKNLASERFLSNFRLKCSIESHISPYNEESVMNINVILEPLILAFGMRQVRKIMGFLPEVTGFLSKMNERYVPYITPDKVVNGIVQIPPKKKKIVKDIFKKILVRNLLKNILKEAISNVQTKKKEIFINTNRFNSQTVIDCKINKICLSLFDNTQSSKTTLLQINLTKLLVNMNLNSRLRDKENMSLSLYEMLTAENLPRTSFNLNKLGMYLDLVFSLDANYYNIMINDFEPLLERFNMGVTILQTAPFCKMKGYITTNDVINFNLSTDSVIALNQFLLTFMQDEKMWEVSKRKGPDLLEPIKDDIIETNNFQKEQESEIVLSFINLTGIDTIFYFDDNPNYKIPLQNGGKCNFTRKKLYVARGHDKHRDPYQKTTFSLCIGDCKPIENINFLRNNYRQFKANLRNNTGRRYPIYFGVKVESVGIESIVSFCPSLSFYNDTKFDRIILSINNPNIVDKKIISIPKQEKEYIPLTWFMCDSPESTVSIKLSENGQNTQICNNISEFIVPPIIDQQILKEREAEKKNVAKSFPNANNPTFIKMLDIKKSEFDNRKDSKSFMINDNNMNQSICLDYFLLQSKYIKKLREKIKNDPDQQAINTEHNIPLDTNASMVELIPTGNQKAGYDYEYVVYVRPSITIINKIPFAINITSQNGNIIIDTLEKEYFYNNNMSNLTFTMEYNRNIYTSNSFSLNQENIYVDLISNAAVPPLKCHIFRNPVNITIPSPQKFYCDIQDYSISSYEYVFFFDYIFTNRLTKTIWVRPCDSKGIQKLTPAQINQNILELKPTSISLLSLPNYEPNCVIKDEHSPWSEPFNMNTIGVQGVVKLDSTNYAVAPGTISTSQYNQNLNFQATNEIACLLNGSAIYDFSAIIVFEPKYIIINNLGFDVVYKQEGYTNTYPLRIKNHQSLIYEKGGKDFRIGIIDDSTGTYNFSGIFNLENIMDVDIKIKIDRNSPKYNNNQMKIFSYDRREYYILIRVINQTYDEGTVYILLTHPTFPYFEIANLTHAPLRIYEEHCQGITITNLKDPIVPFVWENSNKHGDKIYFEVYQKRGSFNYSVFKEEYLDISERATKLIYGVSSKNKTITRRFEIKTKEETSSLEQDELRLYFKDKSRPKTMHFDLFIKGFGISIIDNTPQEVFYISLYNLRVLFTQNVLVLNGGAQTNSTMNVELYIGNLQVDYCLNDSLRVVLAPRDQLVPSIETDMRLQAKSEGREIVPFVQVLLTMSTKINNFKEEKLSAFDQIDFTMQEFDIKVEQYALMNVLKIVLEMVGAFDFANKIKVKEDKEPLLDIETHIPLKKLLNENENSVMNLIYYLLIGALKFNLTLRLDLNSIPLGLPVTIKRVIGTIGNTLGRISDCPLRFNEKVIQNVYLSWPEVANRIVKSYIAQGIAQIYKVLGSLDIIGNPVNLVLSIGGGFYDFVNEPRKGFKMGPKEFGIGVAKGFGSLIYGIVGGVFNSVQRISGTLYAATQSLTGYDRESISIEHENEPTNIISGFAEGFKGFGREIGKGFYGFCYEPCQKSKTGGTSELCKGLGIGFLKLVISPFAGLLKFITCVFAGFKNTCYLLTGKKKIKTSRFRHPRVIVEGDKRLNPYEDNKAEARELLYQLENIDTNNILFADDFICPDCQRRISTAILTDEHMYVVYDNRKIIFKLNTGKAENAYLHYIDNKFYLVFYMNDKSKRGFPIRYDYSTVATKLQDILYHKYNKGQIMYSIEGPHGPEVVYKDLTLDVLFDKSSYTNTLIGTHSVYSDKTLFSKISRKKNVNKEKNMNNNIINTINENESVQELNPKAKTNGYVSLNIK